MPNMQQVADLRDRNIAQVFVALQWGDKTLEQVAEFAGVHHQTARRWINLLRDEGAVYVAGVVATERKGREAKVYALQPKPFAMEDAA